MLFDPKDTTYLDPETVIGMETKEIMKRNLNAAVNQLIQDGKVHIEGLRIVRGPSRIKNPLKLR